MFCNFCGKKIAPEDRVCPYCGQAQESRSGGNGFWDILTNPSAADDADPEPVRTVREPVRPMREPAPPMPTPPVPSDRRRRKTGRGILILSIITVVLLLASIALDALLLFNIKAKSSDIDEKIGALNTQLAQRNETLGDMNQSIDAFSKWVIPPSDSSESTDASETTPPTEEPQVTDPEADATSLSETAGDAANVQLPEAHIIDQPSVTAEKELTVKYEGVKVIWKYMSDSGWKEITPADKQFEIIDDKALGISTLKVIGEDIHLYTKYMCVVKGADGREVESKPVNLVQNPASPNP